MVMDQISLKKNSDLIDNHSKRAKTALSKTTRIKVFTMKRHLILGVASYQALQYRF